MITNEVKHMELEHVGQSDWYLHMPDEVGRLAMHSRYATELVHRYNVHDELLEALKNLTSMVERYKHAELSNEPLVQYFDALAAIARAEGRP